MSATVEGDVPLRVSELGVKVHVVPAGKLEQVRLTCWLKPKSGVSTTEYDAGAPAVTVSRAGDPAREKVSSRTVRFTVALWEPLVPVTVKM